jgi:hypothetical protein
MGPFDNRIRDITVPVLIALKTGRRDVEHPSQQLMTQDRIQFGEFVH